MTHKAALIKNLKAAGSNLFSDIFTELHPPTVLG